MALLRWHASVRSEQASPFRSLSPSEMQIHLVNPDGARFFPFGSQLPLKTIRIWHRECLLLFLIDLTDDNNIQQKPRVLRLSCYPFGCLVQRIRPLLRSRRKGTRGKWRVKISVIVCKSVTDKSEQTRPTPSESMSSVRQTMSKTSLSFAEWRPSRVLSCGRLCLTTDT